MTLSYRSVVLPWQCDQMRHMNVQFYAEVEAAAVANFLASLPVCEAPHASSTWCLRSQSIAFRRELHEGRVFSVSTELVDAAPERIVLRSTMVDDVENFVAAEFTSVLDVPRAGLAERSLRSSDVAGAAEEGWVPTHLSRLEPWECGVAGEATPRAIIARLAAAEAAFISRSGLSPGEFRHRRIGGAVLQYEVQHHAIGRAGDAIGVLSRVRELRRKTACLQHRLTRHVNGVILAEVDTVSIFFDLGTRKAIPLPDEISRAWQVRPEAAG